MKIILTENAIARLNTWPGPAGNTHYKLVYDTEGCGCAVNGMAALWIVPGPQEGDVQAESNWGRLWFEPRQEIFFEEELILDYRAGNRAFVLKSKGQIYNPLLLPVDKRPSPGGTAAE
jgi:uncharacterized protein YqkB